jgi:acetyl esterase
MNSIVDRPAAEVSIDVPQIGAVMLRIREPAGATRSDPIVLHCHGGAFTCGCATVPSPLADSLLAAGALLVSVQYPLAPVQPFPAAPEACYASLMWIDRERARLGRNRRAPLYVAGEEAGATLAAAVALMARDRDAPTLAGTVLLAPMLDPCVGTASLRQRKAGPVGCKWADGWTQYLRNPGDAEHPYAVPALALRQQDLPRTLLISADDDPMRDEACTYAGRLRAAGVRVESLLLPGPTGWPCSLADCATHAPHWQEALVDGLRRFLANADRPANGPALGATVP